MNIIRDLELQYCALEKYVLDEDLPEEEEDYLLRKMQFIQDEIVRLCHIERITKCC